MTQPSSAPTPPSDFINKLTTVMRLLGSGQDVVVMSRADHDEAVRVQAHDLMRRWRSENAESAPDRAIQKHVALLASIVQTCPDGPALLDQALASAKWAGIGAASLSATLGSAIGDEKLDAPEVARELNAATAAAVHATSGAVTPERATQVALRLLESVLKFFPEYTYLVAKAISDVLPRDGLDYLAEVSRGGAAQREASAEEKPLAPTQVVDNSVAEIARVAFPNPYAPNELVLWELEQALDKYDRGRFIGPRLAERFRTVSVLQNPGGEAYAKSVTIGDADEADVRKSDDEDCDACGQDDHDFEDTQSLDVFEINHGGSGEIDTVKVNGVFVTNVLGAEVTTFEGRPVVVLAFSPRQVTVTQPHPSQPTHPDTAEGV